MIVSIKNLSWMQVTLKDMMPLQLLLDAAAIVGAAAGCWLLLLLLLQLQLWEATHMCYMCATKGLFFLCQLDGLFSFESFKYSNGARALKY